MPKVAALQSGFDSGELSPMLYGTPENPKYKRGLRQATNYICTLQGSAVRRPGTAYVTNVKDSTKQPILVPFNVSKTETFMLEFGDQYIRFYQNNAPVKTVGSTQTVAGTWWVRSTVLSDYLNPLNTSPGSQTFNNWYGCGFTGLNSSDPSTWPSSNQVPDTINSVSNNSILELQSPYAYTDLSLLRWAQQGNTLYLVHPNYTLYKLVFSSATKWTLFQVMLQDGPYLALNTYQNTGDGVAITLNVGTGSSATPRVSAGPELSISNVQSYTGGVFTGVVSITTSAAHGLGSGQNVFIKSVVGSVGNVINNDTAVYPATVGYYWTISVISTTAFVLVGSTFSGAYVSGGKVEPALWGPELAANAATVIGGATGLFPSVGRNIAIVDSNGSRYWGWIYAIENAYQVDAYFPLGCGPNTTNSDGWYLGSYWSTGGYPSCTSFHQNRLVLAGQAATPQEIDLSTSASYENFAPSTPTGSSALQVVASNAIQETLVSSDTNPIYWIKGSAQGLLAGTATGEWAITPDGTGGALSPLNFNAARTSTYGSAQIDAQPIGNAAMFIQRAQRKVREMVYFFQIGTFRATEMTNYSEHLTVPSILQLAIQKEIQPLVWAIRSDGALLSMVYNRDDISLSTGWTKHFLGGRSDSAGTPPIVVSMGVMPDPNNTYDQLWLIVKRWLNGATVYTVEYLTTIFNDAVLQEDAIQGDCATTVYNPKTITGISVGATTTVTSASHGFSNGDTVKIVGVVGLNKSTTDVNGNVTISNLVNEQTFVVASVATNTFVLHDFNGNAIVSTGYSAWVSGGQAAKLVSTVSGLTYLENETVGVLCDGALAPADVVVSNSGSITLPFPAAKVQIGYRFNSQGQLMRVEGGAADGTSFGKIRRTYMVGLQVYRMGDLSIGTDFTKLLPVEFSQADQNLADNAVPLYSGMFQQRVESAYDFESELCFQQNSMLPGMIQSITSFMNEEDA